MVENRNVPIKKELEMEIDKFIEIGILLYNEAMPIDKIFSVFKRYLLSKFE